MARRRVARRADRRLRGLSRTRARRAPPPRSAAAPPRPGRATRPRPRARRPPASGRRRRCAGGPRGFRLRPGGERRGRSASECCSDSSAGTMPQGRRRRRRARGRRPGSRRAAASDRKLRRSLRGQREQRDLGARVLGALQRPHPRSWRPRPRRPACPARSAASPPASATYAARSGSGSSPERRAASSRRAAAAAASPRPACRRARTVTRYRTEREPGTAASVSSASATDSSHRPDRNSASAATPTRYGAYRRSRPSRLARSRPRERLLDRLVPVVGEEEVQGEVVVRDDQRSRACRRPRRAASPRAAPRGPRPAHPWPRGRIRGHCAPGPPGRSRRPPSRSSPRPGRPRSTRRTGPSP